MSIQLLEYIVKQLVEQPDRVTISQTTQENNKSLVLINVAQVDLKRIIGKDGRVIRALRALFSSVFPDHFELTVQHNDA